MTFIDTSALIKSKAVAEPTGPPGQPSQAFQDVLVEERARLQDPPQAATAGKPRPFQTQQSEAKAASGKDAPAVTELQGRRSEATNQHADENDPAATNPSARRKSNSAGSEPEEDLSIDPRTADLVRADVRARQDLPVRDESAIPPAGPVQQLLFDAIFSGNQAVNESEVVDHSLSQERDLGKVAAVNTAAQQVTAISFAAAQAVLPAGSEGTTAIESGRTPEPPVILGSENVPDLQGVADRTLEEYNPKSVPSGIESSEEFSETLEISTTAATHKDSAPDAPTVIAGTDRPKTEFTSAVTGDGKIEAKKRTDQAPAERLSELQAGRPMPRSSEKQAGLEGAAFWKPQRPTQQLSSMTNPETVQGSQKAQATEATVIVTNTHVQRSVSESAASPQRHQHHSWGPQSGEHEQHDAQSVRTGLPASETDAGTGIGELMNASSTDHSATHSSFELAAPVEKLVIAPAVQRPDTTPGLSHQWSQIEKASVVSQLVEKAQLLAGKNHSELTIVLKPEFLGRVNLHAALVENSLVATIAAESPQVKQLLESQLSTLQTALQEQGLPVVKVEVVQGNQLNFSEFSHGQASPQNQGTRQPHGLFPGDLPPSPAYSQGENPGEVPPLLSSSRLIHLVA